MQTSFAGSSHCFWLSATVCFGQRQNEPRPAPLDPVQAEKEARALVAEMLAQKPEQNTTNTGRVRIRDAAGKEREIPVRFEITATPTNWVSVYETLPPAGGPGGMRLTVIHSDEQPNQYQLIDHAGAGATNAVAKELAPDQTMIPFAGSDFWVADLGLEFLHWPRQRLLQRKRCGTANPATCWRASTQRRSRAATRGWYRGS